MLYAFLRKGLGESNAKDIDLTSGNFPATKRRQLSVL
jgi:hypothetical protein